MERPGNSGVKKNESKEVIVISSDSEDEPKAEGEREVIVISSESEVETDEGSKYWGEEESGVEGLEEDECITEGQGQENWEDPGTDTESGSESNLTEYTEGSGEMSEFSEQEEGYIIWHQPVRVVKRRFAIAAATLPLRLSRHHCLHVIRSVKTF